MAGYTKLSLLLLELFAKGDIPGTTLHRLAKAASDDGWGGQCPLAQALVGVGSGGSQPSHFVRDIIAVAGEFGLVSCGAKPYKVDLDNNYQAWVFLPHEIVHHVSMRRGGHQQWALDADTLKSGQGLGGQLREWAAHPDVQFAGDVSQVGIAGIHVDGVTFISSNRAGGQRSIAVVSMNIISGSEVEVRNQRHILFAVSKGKLCDCCMGFHSYQKLLDVIAWSFRCLSQGRSPSLRHDGAAFTDDDVKDRLPKHAVVPHFALLQARGDWEWIAQAFRLPWPSSSACCWKCSVDMST